MLRSYWPSSGHSAGLAKVAWREPYSARGSFGMSSELNEITARVIGALDIVSAGTDDGLRAHMEWEAREMITHLSPDKLTNQELAALIAVLHAAHARELVLPTGGRPILRIASTLEAPELNEPVA